MCVLVALLASSVGSYKALGATFEGNIEDTQDVSVMALKYDWFSLSVFGAWIPSKEVIPVAPPKPIEMPMELKRICSCESTGSPNNEPIQFKDDGSVLRGTINPDDVGMCQINLYHHGERALELGIDLFTEEGNKEYATMLYNEQGTTPWNWSKGCWASNGG